MARNRRPEARLEMILPQANPTKFEEALERARHIDFGYVENQLKFFWEGGIRSRDAEIADLKRQLRERDAARDDKWLASKKFYDLMQMYRHAPITDQEFTIARFEDVQNAIRAYVQEKLNEKRLELCKGLGIDPAHSWANIIETFNEAVENVQEKVDRAVLAESEWWNVRGSDMWRDDKIERLTANRAKVKP